MHISMVASLLMTSTCLCFAGTAVSSECIQLHNLGLWLCMSCIAVEWADALIPHAQLCSHMHQLYMAVQAYMLHLCVVSSLFQHGDRSLNMEVGHHVYCNER